MKFTTFTRFGFTAALVVAAITFAACGNNTEVEQTWTAPQLEELSFKRIVVVATTPDGAARRTVEDEVRNYITSATVIQGYTLLPDEKDLKDHAKLKAALQKANADGLLVVRPISDEREIQFTSGAYPTAYHSTSGYWGADYGLRPFYGDSTSYTDRVIQVETSIYDAKAGKLVWSGVTATRNPGSIKDLIGDIVKTLRGELRKQKLIP